MMNTVSICWILSLFFPIIDANWITGNLCWSMPCMNGGSCFGSAYTYLCICPINYNGILCEKPLDVCQDNPCGNRGQCIETSLTSFGCQCYSDYKGPTCEEHVPKTNPDRWSSLSPTQTLFLFDMLKEAYQTKSEEEGSVGTDNNQIDFISLLNTTEPTIVITTPPILTTTILDNTSTVSESETTEEEYIIPAQDIQLEEIFSDMNTDEHTEPSDRPTTFVPNSVTDLTSATTATVEQYQSTFPNTTEDLKVVNTTEQSSTLITSIPTQLSNDTTTQNLIEETSTNVESIGNTTTIPIEVTSTDMYIINDEAITSSTDISEYDATTNSQTSHREFIDKFCRQVLSHILPTTSTVSLTSGPSSVKNYSTDILVSCLRQYFNSLTTTVPSVLVNTLRTSSIPLQRIDIDDILHQMNNDNIDNEN